MFLEFLNDWSCEYLVNILQDNSELEVALERLHLLQLENEQQSNVEDQDKSIEDNESLKMPAPTATKFSTPESSPSREFDICAPPDAIAAAQLLDLVSRIEPTAEVASQITERLLEERDYSVRELLADQKKLTAQVDRAKLRFIRDTLEESVIKDRYLDKLGFLLSEFYSPETCKLLISHMRDLSLDDLEEMIQRRPVLQHKAKLLYQSLQ